MGMWDQLRSVAKRVINRKNPDASSDLTESRGFYGSDLTVAITKFGDTVRSNGVQKLEEYIPDPNYRDKIGRIVTNLGRFAVSSAVNESLKGVTGGVQVYKIVKEGLQDQSSSRSANGNKKPDLTATVEEMQAKMEKMQEEMNNIKQQNAILTHGAKPLDPLKELAEPSEERDPPKTDGRKVMIRSRL